jgi:hypothetical protein
MTYLRMRTSLCALAASAMCALLALTGSGPAQANQEPTTSAINQRPQTLPPIPAGLPNYYSFGLFNSSSSTLPAGVPVDYRYQYLAGGVNTGDGWATWNPNGGYATNYINDSRSHGTIPGFIYYQILQSSPGYDEYSNFQNATTMRDYYDDFKLLMQKCGQAGGAIIVNIEPDLNGVMQQHSSNTNNDASRQPVKVASSGHPDVAGYPDNFRGFYQALAHIRDIYGPNTLLGLNVSSWGAGADISIVTDPSFDWQGHATDTATYLNSVGPGFQLLFWDPSDRDAAWYASQGSPHHWWDDTNVTYPNFNRMVQWMGSIVQQMQRRVMMWQVPNGNRVYRSENNTDGHWQDNRSEYFLNPTTGRAHITEWANYGFLGMMYGAGVGSQSHYFDYRGDGITNPAPINGNNETAIYPDDDGGYLRINMGNYYSGGTIPLPGGSVGPTPTPAPPTATRTPAPPAATRTRTRTPLPTQTPGGPTATPTPCTVSFSDVQPSDYFYAAVQYLACHGAISGYADGTFRPVNTTTRAQLSKIVVLAEGWPINTSGGPHFTDVPTSHAFYSYIETAYNHQIISGYSDDTFRPGNNVTRAQLSKIVVTAEGWSINTSGGPHFSDVPTSHGFYSYIETAYNHGIISGYADGTFRPGNSATRGQISKIVYEAITGP